MSASIASRKFARPTVILALCLQLRSLYVSTQRTRNRLYATKTAYDHSFSAEELKQRNDSRRFHPSFCQPIHISGLFRHGTRNPSPTDIKKMQATFKKIRGKITSPEFQDLNMWTNPFRIDEAKDLTQVGYEELKGIGVRLAQRNSDLLQNAERHELHFISSSKVRCIDSCRAFQEGMETTLSKDINKEIQINDRITRFHDNCEKYRMSVEKNIAAAKEFHTFRKGPEAIEVAFALSQRLGLNEKDALKPGDLKGMYTTCALEEAMYGESNWCKVFTQDDLQVLEYISDLKAYWLKAHGHAIVYQQSCPLLEHIFRLADEAVHSYSRGDSYVKGVFRFAHAETVLPLLARLGLYNDTVLRADNFHENYQRNFRSGRVSTFAANVGIVLFACDPKAQDPEEEAPPGVKWPPHFSPVMAQLLMRERPERFPFCDYDLCPYEDVRKHYAQYVSDCNFEKLCALNSKLDRQNNDEL